MAGLSFALISVVGMFIVLGLAGTVAHRHDEELARVLRKRAADRDD